MFTSVMNKVTIANMNHEKLLKINGLTFDFKILLKMLFFWTSKWLFTTQRSHQMWLQVLNYFHDTKFSKLYIRILNVHKNRSEYHQQNSIHYIQPNKTLYLYVNLYHTSCVRIGTSLVCLSLISWVILVTKYL